MGNKRFTIENKKNKKRIKEIEKEFEEEDLSVEDFYFQKLCDENSKLELELLDLEFELEWNEKNRDVFSRIK